MKVSLTVKDEAEKNTVERAWENPTLRATVIVVGLLEQLPTDRARQRALDYVVDKLDEDIQGE